MPSIVHAVPGVYYEPAPRRRQAPALRTDVAGFVGFEPRVRDGAPPTRLIGDPVIGHSFVVRVADFQLAVGSVPRPVPAGDVVLSADDASIPIADGQSIVYALVAAEHDDELALEVIAGAAAPTGEELVPSDADIAVALGGPVPWRRVVDIAVVREGAGVQLRIVPHLRPMVCDDWRDYVLAFGDPVDDGTVLGATVRAFFANGGGRAVIETVTRPRFHDLAGLERAREEMLGVRGSPLAHATGIERLLLVDEVSLVAAPDLHARRVDSVITQVDLPPLDRARCFDDCAELLVPGTVEASGERRPHDPLYAAADVRASQVAMAARCASERWRVLVLIAPPLELDPIDGAYRAPTTPATIAWRDALVADLVTNAGLTAEELSVAAAYAPWLLTQERVGAPVVELIPTGFAAGVIARRDLSRGPHVAAANESIAGAVGGTRSIDDAAQVALRSGGHAVNSLRAFAGAGVYVWEARTLSPDRFLRYLPVRRCLSAIQRRVKAALDPLVFESHTQLLRLTVTQAVVDGLVPLFEQGALRGRSIDEAFYVRCDDSTNPPESVAAGRLVCEVGVAIAAPAELIVFRVGRREGVVEVIP